MSPQVKLLTNLQEIRAPLMQAAVPLVLLLSRSDCPFCHTVRVHYLSTFARDELGQELIVREFMTDKEKTVIGWNGETLATAEFLKQIRVKFFPTVVFLNDLGEQLYEPLVGMDQAGFYGAYLERGLEHAKRRAKESRRST